MSTSEIETDLRRLLHIRGEGPKMEQCTNINTRHGNKVLPARHQANRNRSERNRERKLSHNLEENQHGTLSTSAPSDGPNHPPHLLQRTASVGSAPHNSKSYRMSAPPRFLNQNKGPRGASGDGQPAFGHVDAAPFKRAPDGMRRGKGLSNAFIQALSLIDGNNVIQASALPGAASAPKDNAAKKKKKKKKSKKKKVAKGLDVEEQWQEEVRRILEFSQEADPRIDMARIIFESQVTPEKAEQLIQNHVFPLKKKSLQHPSANYYCSLCDYHCDTIAVSTKHISTKRHKESLEVRKLRSTLKCIPPPCEAQVCALSELLEETVARVALTESDREQRDQLVRTLSALLRPELDAVTSGCALTLYGSSVTAAALNDSNINIDLCVLDMALSPKCLLAVYNKLHNESNLTDSDYEDVRKDFGAKLPCIYFKYLPLCADCVISLNNASACQTSTMIREYLSLDPRARTLAIAFRYWAQLCGLDKQRLGFLAPHAFALMLIYFLQRRSPPVVPVLCENPTEKRDSPPQPSQSSARATKKKPNEYEISRAAAMEGNWKSENTQSLGSLWVELLRYYSVIYPDQGYVVCIRQRKRCTVKAKNWRGRRLSIEDPYVTKRNLARTVTLQRGCDYVYNCFRYSYKYFSIAQTRDGPLFEDIDPQLMCPTPRVRGARTSVGEASGLCENVSLVFDHFRQQGDQKLISVSTGLPNGLIHPSNDPRDGMKTQDSGNSSCSESEDSEEEGDSGESERGASSADESEPEVANQEDGETLPPPNAMKHRRSSRERENVDSEPDDDDDDEAIIPRHAIPVEIIEKLAMLQKCDVVYKFDDSISTLLTNYSQPPIECSLCNKIGHYKDECPDEELPPLRPIPDHLPKAYRNELDGVCAYVMQLCHPQRNDVKMRSVIMDDLRAVVVDKYDDATLELFGSSCNGFGFRRSDIDICLVFSNDPTGKKLDHGKVIETLFELLKPHSSVMNVIAIPTAKVPIVKFTHRASRLECDISLYNTLALVNTRMLHTYSRIDSRVRVLGYTMKYFAKICNICDASRGSLSSYAYILMVLFFLQQRQPPVIPVLQELYEGEKKPERSVDGWDAYYFDNLQDLHKVWPHKGKNSETVAELWVGLLRFYTEQFNFQEQVITIRQLAPLTRFEKLWTTRSIAIEDPFDRNHNLGSGVSRKMNTYIMKTLIRGREIFGTPILLPPPPFKCIGDYLFAPHMLVSGPPPNDRCCRVCGRIGHMARDCPKRKHLKEVKQQNRERQEMRRELDAKHASPPKRSNGNPLLQRPDNRKEAHIVERGPLRDVPELTDSSTKGADVHMTRQRNPSNPDSSKRNPTRNPDNTKHSTSNRSLQDVLAQLQSIPSTKPQEANTAAGDGHSLRFGSQANIDPRMTVTGENVLTRILPGLKTSESPPPQPRIPDYPPQLLGYNNPPAHAMFMVPPYPMGGGFMLPPMLAPRLDRPPPSEPHACYPPSSELTNRAGNGSASGYPPMLAPAVLPPFWNSGAALPPTSNIPSSSHFPPVSSATPPFSGAGPPFIGSSPFPALNPFPMASLVNTAFTNPHLPKTDIGPERDEDHVQREMSDLFTTSYPPGVPFHLPSSVAFSAASNVNQAAFPPVPFLRPGVMSQPPFSSPEPKTQTQPL